MAPARRFRCPSRPTAPLPPGSRPWRGRPTPTRTSRRPASGTPPPESSTLSPGRSAGRHVRPGPARRRREASIDSSASARSPTSSPGEAGSVVPPLRTLQSVRRPPVTACEFHAPSLRASPGGAGRLSPIGSTDPVPGIRGNAGGRRPRSVRGRRRLSARHGGVGARIRPRRSTRAESTRRSGRSRDGRLLRSAPPCATTRRRGGSRRGIAVSPGASSSLATTPRSPRAMSGAPGCPVYPTVRAVDAGCRNESISLTGGRPSRYRD